MNWPRYCLELEGSLLHSQEPATRPYPESHEPSPGAFSCFPTVPLGALQGQIPSAHFYPVLIFGSGVPSLAIIVVRCNCKLLSTRDYTEHGQIVVIFETSVSTAADGWAKCVNIMFDVRTSNDALLTDPVVNALRRRLYVAYLAMFVIFSIC